MEFNQLMRNLREKTGLTQEEAAIKMGVTTNTIQNWERGSCKPGIELLSVISEVYTVKTDDIIQTLRKDNNMVDNMNKFDYDYFKFSNLLPNDLDYSSIKNLVFTREEQDLFIIMCMNLKFYDNPVPVLVNYNNNIFEVMKALDKFDKFSFWTNRSYNFSGSYNCSGDIYTSQLVLTKKALCIYNLIKDNNNELFNVYNLSLKDFLAVLEAFDIYNCPIEKINNIVNEDVKLSIVKHKNEYDEYRNGYYRTRYEHIDNLKFAYDSFYLEKELAVSKDISDCYYDIKQVELDDEIYKVEKESYLMKLNFYNEHKDKIDNINAPNPFKECFIKTAVATQKAKDLIKEYYNN